MKDSLKLLIEEMEKEMGKWDGNEPGYREDQANIARDIIEKSNELIELINELNGTN